MIKMRVVTDTFEVHSRLVDIPQNDGKKTALAKSELIAASLQHLACGDERVLNVVKAKTQAGNYVSGNKCQKNTAASDPDLLGGYGSAAPKYQAI